MTKYNGVIRLAEQPKKMIDWFTKNFDNEIGALGIGRIKDQEILVEKLVFPKQIVNGAHVHFKPEDWGPIIAELSEDEIKRILFYWHKHPGGCPNASSGDEEDTFDVFMDETSNRKIFGFLQTAYNSRTGEIVSEARIEMRKPLWASIDAEVVTDEDTEIEEICEQIIKEKITKGYASAQNQPGAYGNNENKYMGKKSVICTEEVHSSLPSNNPKKIINCAKPVFNVFKTNSGAVKVIISSYLSKFIESKLEEPDVSNLISYKNQIADLDRQEILYYLQPAKKCLKQLHDILDEYKISIIGDDEIIDHENLDGLVKVGEEQYLNTDYEMANRYLSKKNYGYSMDRDVDGKFYRDLTAG